MKKLESEFRSRMRLSALRPLVFAAVKRAVTAAICDTTVEEIQKRIRARKQAILADPEADHAALYQLDAMEVMVPSVVNEAAAHAFDKRMADEEHRIVNGTGELHPSGLCGWSR